MKTIVAMLFAVLVNLALVMVIYVINNKEKKSESQNSLAPSYTVFVSKHEPLKEKTQKSETKKTQAEKEKSKEKRIFKYKPSMLKFLSGVRHVAGVDIGSPSVSLPSIEDVKKMQLTSPLLRESKEEKLEEETVDVPPRVLFRKEPDYPRMARLQEIEGLVEIEFILITSGVIQDIKITRSVPKGIFDNAVLEAMKLWKFEPAIHKGNRVNCGCRLRFRFVLIGEIR